VGVVDGDAKDVAGQQIAGELDAMEAAIDGAGERMGQRGFADSGDIFNEEVSAGEQADQGQADYFGLAADGQTERRLERVQGGRRAQDGLPRHLNLVSHERPRGENQLGECLYARFQAPEDLSGFTIREVRARIRCRRMLPEGTFERQNQVGGVTLGANE